MQQKIRVMVVDDSLVFRTWLMQSLSADPALKWWAMPSTLWTPRVSFLC